MRSRLVQEEDGIALVLALLTLLVLSMTTAAILTATAVNHRSSLQSARAKQAFALAEQGLAYAQGRLYSAPTTAESVLVPGTTITPDDGVGTITYSGVLCDSTSTPACIPKVWTLYGTGRVAGVSRTVSAQATIPTVTTTVSSSQVVTTTDSTVWNYIYVANSSGCTSISGSVTINVPLYTKGGLCLTGAVAYTGSDLEVAGALSLTGSARIGSNAARISKLNVAGACSPAPCDGSHTPIWVNVPGVGHTLTPVLTKPPVDLAGNYANDNPGPATGHDCQAGSAVPTSFFDNDHVLNKSNGTINLFPAGKPYDCLVGSNEIKWNGSNTLLVNGAFYFDGSMSLSGATAITYTGRGTLYFTGTISQSGSTSLCGIAACTGQWNPNTNAIVLVAGCWSNTTGTVLVTSGCVSISGSAKLQTGIYSVTDIGLSGSAVNMGPMISNSLTISGSVGQMLPFHTVPPGAPVNSTTTTVTTSTTTTSDGTPQAPTNWNG
jgi:Tfp pilus assembly protein PilX